MIYQTAPIGVAFIPIDLSILAASIRQQGAKQRAKLSRFWSAPLWVDSFNDLN